MVNFVDEYPRQLDERGRIILPAKVRENMSETVYVTRSMSDKCLQLYTQEEWDKISEKINQLPTAIDKQGRVPIAKRLMEYANLKKDVVLVGANTRLEIWDSEEWDRYQDELSDDIMMDGILNYGLNI